MGDRRRSPSRKHFKRRMVPKGVFCLFFIVACATLTTSQSYGQKPITYPTTTTYKGGYQYTTKYPPTKYPSTTKYTPTKYPTTKYPTTKYTPTKYPPTKYPPTKYPPTKYPPTHPTHPPTKCPQTHPTHPPTKYPPTTPHHGGYQKSLCECINPFIGYPHAYRGDPETLCGPQGPGVCYVDCNADCRDIKPTASASRCKSSLACDIKKGAEWQ